VWEQTERPGATDLSARARAAASSPIISSLNATAAPPPTDRASTAVLRRPHPAGGRGGPRPEGAPGGAEPALRRRPQGAAPPPRHRGLVSGRFILDSPGRWVGATWLLSIIRAGNQPRSSSRSAPNLQTARWALYDYGPETVASWPADHRPQYPGAARLAPIRD
jgi:hypothetical protein